MGVEHQPTSDNEASVSKQDADWGLLGNVSDTLEVGSPAYRKDKFFYRVVVITLSIVAAGSLLGGLLLTAYDKEIHDSVVALGSASVGALAGVLADSRTV